MLDPNYKINEAEVKSFVTSINESGKRLLHTVKKFIYYTEVELLLNTKENTETLQNECKTPLMRSSFKYSIFH
jgi:hypothetical protein